MTDTVNLTPSKLQYSSQMSTLLNEDSPEFSFTVPSQSFGADYFARTLTYSFKLERQNLIANMRMIFDGLQSAWTMGNGCDYQAANYEIECFVRTYNTTEILFTVNVVPLNLSGSYSTPTFTVRAVAPLFRAPWPND